MDYLIARLKESSTWAGITLFVTGVLHYTLPPEVTQAITVLGTFFTGLFLATTKEAPKA